MLTFSRAQTAALEEAAGLRFVDQVLADLAPDHEDVFGGLPLFVRRAMVANGLAAAGRLGFTEQASLLTFVSLQCGFAPDFHAHPRVAEALARPGEEEDRLEAVLALPETVWQQVDVYGSELAWFDPAVPDQRAARIAFRACGILPAITEERSEAQAWTLFSQAERAAARHGIDWEEGLSVFAAAQGVYGSAFDQDGGPAWARRVFTHPALPADTVVNLLRLRLNLDFDCLL